MERDELCREFQLVLAAKRIEECKNIEGLRQLCFHLLKRNACMADIIRQLKTSEIPEFTSMESSDI